MNFRLISFFTLFVFSLRFAVADSWIVSGYGIGVSDEQALAKAKTDAIEKSVGMLLSSESIVENYTTISDLIVSKANGLIKKYNIVKQSLQGEFYEVEISAEIVQVVDEIIKDEMALKLLIAEMGIPSLGVIVSDNDSRRDKNSENIITSQLLKKGFKLKKINISSADELDEAKRQGLDYLLAGTVNSESVNMSNIYNIQSMKSMQTTLECQILDCSTKEVVAAKVLAGKGAHISENTARLKSLEECVPKLVSFLLISAIERWSREVSTALRDIELEVSGIEGQKGSKLYSLLSGKFQGTEMVIDKGYSQEKQFFIVRSLLSSDQLFKLLNLQDEFKDKFVLKLKDKQKLAVALKSAE